MQAVILAGGRGERLRPISDKIPKPMVKIKGKPILEYTIKLLKKNGINNIVFNLCYKPESFRKYFGDGRKFGVKISYNLENPARPLGTAGSLSKLRNKLKKTFLVLYGDILRESNIKRLIKFHQQKKGLGTICVYKNSAANPKSIVTFDKNDRITSFIERPDKIIKNVWSNASCYLLEPEIFAFLPKNQFADFGRDVFPKVISAGKKLSAFRQKGYFLDIGDQGKLEQAEKDWKKICF